LRHPGFRMLAIADTISQCGSQIGLVALPLVALLVLHATPAQLGLLTAAQTAGFLVVGLPSGVWVDRVRKRPVMIACDVVRAAAFGSVPLVAAFDALTLGQLYAVAAVAGIATVFFEVAYQSYLPFLVGRTHLIEGNTKLAVIRSAAAVAGPGVGGWLVRLVTAPVTVLADAVSFLGSALFLIFIRQREPRPFRHWPNPPPRRHHRRGPHRDRGRQARWIGRADDHQ
jgi:MFS family permease